MSRLKGIASLFATARRRRPVGRRQRPSWLSRAERLESRTLLTVTPTLLGPGVLQITYDPIAAQSCIVEIEQAGSHNIPVVDFTADVNVYAPSNAATTPSSWFFPNISQIIVTVQNYDGIGVNNNSLTIKGINGPSDRIIIGGGGRTAAGRWSSETAGGWQSLLSVEGIDDLTVTAGGTINVSGSFNNDTEDASIRAIGQVVERAADQHTATVTIGETTPAVGIQPRPWLYSNTIEIVGAELDIYSSITATDRIDLRAGDSAPDTGRSTVVAISSVPRAATTDGPWMIDLGSATNDFDEISLGMTAAPGDATVAATEGRIGIRDVDDLAVVDFGILASTDPAKRQKLVDLLLGLTGDPKLNVHDNDYAAYWALKWSDLIRSNSAAIGEQGMWALNNWLKTSFRENKPFDKIVRELVTAKGSTFSNGPANFFRIASNPPDLTEATTQLFLGVRLQCAKCHNHPYEPFSQTDYYAFAAFFARVGNKASQEFGLFGGETVIMNQAGGEVSHPRTGKILPPTPLRGKPVTETNDRRQSLADWMTAKDNNYFARNLVNRMFAYLMGRGLVEPIDDMRGTNPASNPELLDALAKEFIRTGYDQKQLIRLILNSRLYQLDSQPLPGNAADVKFHSHYHVKRIPAEPLLDAIDSATGVRTKFEKVPLGTKAIELPDAKYNNYFLSAFGKPRREAVCECERVSEPNLAQALHTLNGDMIETKIATPTGRVGVLMAEKKSPVEIIENLYLATLSREPTREERETCLKLLAEAKDPKAFHQDLLWSLLNTKQFQFVH